LTGYERQPGGETVFEEICRAVEAESKFGLRHRHAGSQKVTPKSGNKDKPSQKIISIGSSTNWNTEEFRFKVIDPSTDQSNAFSISIFDRNC
jgi:hypothetical protein